MREGSLSGLSWSISMLSTDDVWRREKTPPSENVVTLQLSNVRYAHDTVHTVALGTSVFPPVKFSTHPRDLCRNRTCTHNVGIQQSPEYPPSCQQVSDEVGGGGERSPNLNAPSPREGD